MMSLAKENKIYIYRLGYTYGTQSFSNGGEREREKRKGGSVRKDKKEKRRLLKNSDTDHCRPGAWSKQSQNPIKQKLRKGPK